MDPGDQVGRLLEELSAAKHEARTADCLLAYLCGRFQGKLTAMLDQAARELASLPEGDLAREYAARAKGEQT